jgi:enolase
VLKDRGLATAVGDEGGFAPKFESADDALETITKAVKKAGYKMGKEIFIALDVAASEFYDAKKKQYVFKKSDGSRRNAAELIAYYQGLAKKFPIISIEDGCAENDWAGWKQDGAWARIPSWSATISCHQCSFLRKAIDLGVANSILVSKPDRLADRTLDAIAREKNKFTAVISHRSGESEDTTIADIAVATNAGQIKPFEAAPIESPHNQLLRIEEVGQGRDQGGKMR